MIFDVHRAVLNGIIHDDFFAGTAPLTLAGPPHFNPALELDGSKQARD